VLASTVEELQELVTRLEQASKRFVLKINADKTKMMASEGVLCYISNNSSHIEQMLQVNSFSHLGATITDDLESGCKFFFAETMKVTVSTF